MPIWLPELRFDDGETITGEDLKIIGREGSNQSVAAQGRSAIGCHAGSGGE